jgi:polyhydroxybutyrate depolymerase
LVLALHGGGGQGLKFDQSTAGTLIPAAEARGMVLVFPDGIDKQWCDGRTEHLNEGRDCTAIDDVAFISAIIERMAHDYGIDPRRVYATGISNGGFMSIRLALDLTDKIVAVAPVTAQLSVALAEETPPLPISIMIMNGTDDPIVPYDGGEVQLFEFGRGRGEILSTLDTVERFRRYNDCEAVPALVKLPDSEPDDGTAVQIESYTNCADDTEVILVRVVGGGHTWPGGQPYLSPKIVGVVSQEINASEMILDFFLEHARE